MAWHEYSWYLLFVLLSTVKSEVHEHDTPTTSWFAWPRFGVPLQIEGALRERYGWVAPQLKLSWLQADCDPTEPLRIEMIHRRDAVTLRTSLILYTELSNPGPRGVQHRQAATKTIRCVEFGWNWARQSKVTAGFRSRWWGINAVSYLRNTYTLLFLSPRFLHDSQIRSDTGLLLIIQNRVRDTPEAVVNVYYRLSPRFSSFNSYRWYHTGFQRKNST
jgi:hypothetical protein